MADRMQARGARITFYHPVLGEKGFDLLAPLLDSLAFLHEMPMRRVQDTGKEQKYIPSPDDQQGTGGRDVRSSDTSHYWTSYCRIPNAHQ